MIMSYMGTAGLVPAFMQFADGGSFLAVGFGEALLERLTGKESEAFMGGLGLVGAMVVGALVAGYVKVVTPFADGALQGQLDGLLPGLLPLGFVVLPYQLLKRGWRSVWVMVLILAIGMVCGHVGLLASGAE